ncbi:CDP-glycerol:poly(glycerophosphate) glycerophosphotransferase [Pseudovibrio sp. Ad46]|nr:CDP-glycerol:poly(glycerophosphate) glycerophosphotransferase [Pseudovibrio sp. Ad46]
MFNKLKKKYRGFQKSLVSSSLKLVQRLIFACVKIDKNKVVFDHFNGLDVGCNPGYIARKVSTRHADLKTVWLLSNNRKGYNGDWITYGGGGFVGKCIALASAKVVVFNTLNSMSDWPKKKGQIWIQTGHGSFGIKKVGLDLGNKRKQKIIREAKRTNVFLSNSVFETKVFSNGFRFKSKQIIEIGHARSDVFFDDLLKFSLKKEICKKYDYEGKKLVLFAPTHSEFDVDFVKKIDVESILRAFQDRFNGEWVFGLRLHPRTRNKILKNGLSLKSLNGKNVVDLSEHSDMQELLVASDAMITDFSSGIFDFLLTKRPCFFHLEELMRESLQGTLYFDFLETPIPTSFDSSVLTENIRKFDEIRFLGQVDSFLEQAGSYENGRAADNAADIIKALTKGVSVARLRLQYKNISDLEGISSSEIARKEKAGGAQLLQNKAQSGKGYVEVAE